MIDSGALVMPKHERRHNKTRGADTIILHAFGLSHSHPISCHARLTVTTIRSRVSRENSNWQMKRIKGGK